MTKLYRVFAHPEHAEQFLAGEIRLRPFGYYQSLERGRGDRTEGQAHHTEYRPDRTAVSIARGEAQEVASPGPVDVRSECGNDVFICCFTQPPDEAAWKRVRAEFGEVVVEIDDAERLLEEVRAAACHSADPWQRGVIELWPVEYTKGLEHPAATAPDPVKLAVTQKPPSYSYQHEHRLALISFGTYAREVRGRAPKLIRVRLRRALDYARIVSMRLATA